MSITLIEDLAYALKKGQEKEKRAIVFLGAGASKTGGIPLAGELMNGILTRYAEVPAVRRLATDDKKSYTKVMAALGPSDRKELFKEFIDKANINASHIYLAQMMKEGFIDFVFTVNFDNLMQRALGLFNTYPAVYDMAMLKGMTTAPFESPGLVYLHGQYHGFNLLNTDHEFESVSELLKRCFIPVANRPWIVVGYSGDDPVLDYINELGRFEHGLYWVCYNDKEPSDRVSKCFFSSSDKNAFKVKGCDSDSFFVKLHAELGLEQPSIIDTPFSYLKGLQESIVDIMGDDLKKANERLNITKSWIKQAIDTYEQLGAITMPDKKMIELEKLRKSLIDVIITEKYELLPEFIEHNDLTIREYLAIGYFDWGTALYDLGEELAGVDAISHFKKAIEKYQIAVSLKPDFADAYNNWGNSLDSIGEALRNEEKTSYFQQATEKYEKAITLKADFADAYHNWGNSLVNLGESSTGIEAITYFVNATEKYEKAVSLKSDDAESYNRWGIALDNLGQASTGEESLDYFKKAVEKYQRAFSLNPDDADVLNNWGNALSNLGRGLKGDEALSYLKEAEKKYAQAISKKPDMALAYNNWGVAFDDLARKSNKDEARVFFEKALQKYQQAENLQYDDADLYNNWGFSLAGLAQLCTGEEITTYLKSAIRKFEKAIGLKPEDATIHNNLGIALADLGEVSTDAKEATLHFERAVDRFEQAISLKTDFAEAFSNCCATLIDLSYLYGEDEKYTVLSKALFMAQKSHALDGDGYNLACCYILFNDADNAFKYLEDALQMKTTTFDNVSSDLDWDKFRLHPEYVRLKEQYG